MKQAGQFGMAGARNRLKRAVVVTTHLAVGLAYCRAAYRDEAHGYPFTAAFEWRKAAELLTPFAHLADRCWHEWERIMGLPRRLASPF